MTPLRMLAVGLLLAVLLPLVLLGSALSWLRFRVRCWRVGRELEKVQDAAYREWKAARR